jgi:hypothetical protein
MNEEDTIFIPLTDTFADTLGCVSLLDIPAYEALYETYAKILVYDGDFFTVVANRYSDQNLRHRKFNLHNIYAIADEKWSAFDGEFRGNPPETGIRSRWI